MEGSNGGRDDHDDGDGHGHEDGTGHDHGEGHGHEDGTGHDHGQGGAGAAGHGHGIRTTQEFTGDMIIVVLGALFCLPLGLLYYVSEREEMWVCPACQQAVNVGASTCPYCGEDISGHQ